LQSLLEQGTTNLCVVDESRRGLLLDLADVLKAEGHIVADFLGDWSCRLEHRENVGILRTERCLSDEHDLATR
jgi:hypothetical protein